MSLTRTAGLARLGAFSPERYAGQRNYDTGRTTSVLSPFLRRRLVLEREAAEMGGGSEKFVEEVFWRSYFKGYLETRPSIWTDYRGLVADGERRLATEGGLRRAFEAAVGGQTGIECFDDWAAALVSENWLHNHARMWFASIWIFTLGLPWALGAEFFLRHLIDGDPASNTLSWRWVAGLHTRGKAYAARAENISRYTNGRYAPKGLNERPVALGEQRVAPLRALPAADAASGEVALLLHVDDLHPESLPLGVARVVRVGGLVASAEGAAAAVQAADAGAMEDALARAGAYFGCPAGAAVEGWSESLPVVTAWAPVGPSASALPPCARVRREWDELCWPRSTRGYFGLKAAIPLVMGSKG